MDKENIVDYALKKTRIIRMPKQSISTFGVTRINYYALSKIGVNSRIREGKVISEKPKIINPFSILDIFEGFGDDGNKFSEEIFNMFGKNPRILNYKFKNEPNNAYKSSFSISDISEKIEREIERKNNNLAAIIICDDRVWQISIMKFIVDMALKSAGENIADFEKKGLFADKKGIPTYVKNKIEYFFKESAKDKKKIKELGKILTDYGLFKEYEDRFFSLYK